jgi:hypothetical protein
MASAALLCIVRNFFTTPLSRSFAPVIGILRLLAGGARKRSAPYKMRGTHTAKYSLRIVAAVTPLDARVILVNCAIQAWP